MGRVFPQEYPGFLRGKGIITAVVFQEPFRSHVIVLIHQIRPVLPCGFPSSFILAAGRERACGIYNPDSGVFFPDRFMEIRISFKEGCSHLLISDCQVFHPKGSFMPQSGTHRSPFGSPGVPVGKLYQIQGICNPGFQFLQRDYPLVMGIITSRQDGYGPGSDILAQLEIFIKSKPQRLVIAPVISSGGPLP